MYQNLYQAVSVTDYKNKLFVKYSQPNYPYDVNWINWLFELYGY